MLMPLTVAYIIPGLGTNVARLWEFNTTLKIGRFRPQHGFLFGTITSLFGLFYQDIFQNQFSYTSLLRDGLLMGSLIGFWNWIYDIYAIKTNFMVVYNKQHFYQLGAEAVATDYAPVYFGLLGFCYGIYLNIGHHFFITQNQWQYYYPTLLIGICLSLIFPTLGFALFSKVKNGYFGLFPYRQESSW
jgi:hypothetical protein